MTLFFHYSIFLSEMSEITNFHDPESYDETPDSSEDEGFDRTSSNASDYVYHRQVEEKKKWDKFSTTVESDISASEQHTDFIKKASVALKLITAFIVFGVVLTAGVISKGALLFIIAQVRLF